MATFLMFYITMVGLVSAVVTALGFYYLLTSPMEGSEEKAQSAEAPTQVAVAYLLLLAFCLAGIICSLICSEWPTFLLAVVFFIEYLPVDLYPAGTRKDTFLMVVRHVVYTVLAVTLST